MGENQLHGPNRGADSLWENKFGSDKDVLLGTALGYYIRDSRFRVELEYLYRETGYDEFSEITVGGRQVLSKIFQEIVRGEEYIGDLALHNLYIDFSNNSRFMPYAGFGVGLGFTDLEYGGVFQRDIDKANITTALSRNLVHTRCLTA